MNKVDAKRKRRVYRRLKSWFLLLKVCCIATVWTEKGSKFRDNLDVEFFKRIALSINRKAPLLR
jgi:hypothetical protein